jgi:pseudaminic acid synthase
MEIKIGNKIVGKFHPTFIVAEISGNHNGSLDYALELVEAAHFAGADAIKLQTYTADTITLKSNKNDFLLEKNSPWKEYKNLWSLYNHAHTPWEWHETLFKRAKELELEFFSSPFDETAVDFLETFDVPVYKVASPEINHIPLLAKIAQTKKPVILSTGVSDLQDLELAISTLKNNGTKKIVVLKCNSTYPAPSSEANLRTIKDIQEKFNVIAGLSDHTLGSSSAIASVALGGCVIEKHIKLDRQGDSVDSFFSYDANHFKEMVMQIREVEKELGKIDYSISKSAMQSIKGRRSIYVSENIKVGEIISDKNIKIVRPSYGLEPKYFQDCIGKKALRELFPGDRLTKDALEW